MTSPHDPDETNDLRHGVSAMTNAALDQLDAGRASWMHATDIALESEIDEFTIAPNARPADLVRGAAMMIFLAERRSAQLLAVVA